MNHNQDSGRRAWFAVGIAALAVLFSTVLIFGYNTFQDNLGTLQTPEPVAPRWATMPVQWLLNTATPNNNVSIAGCTGSLATCIQQSLTNGFTTWTTAQVAGQTLASLSVSGPNPSTQTSPDYQDCQNVVGFSDTTSGDFSTGTIAFTQVATITQPAGTTGSFAYNCSVGVSKTCNLPDCITDADIEFNPSVNFSTSTTPPSGTFSLQSVATHEEGHLLGLDHSGIGHTVMFPFGDTTSAGQQVQLSTDDAIGISFLYPCTAVSGNCTGIFGAQTGVIPGTVNLSGSGVFAAHVIAVNANTGSAVTDGLTAPDGSYRLIGVPPGNYYVLALPLAANSSSGILTLDNFSGWECGYADSACSSNPQNPTNFTGRYH